MDEHLNIAIDGPAGAGKSTLAKGIAKRLNIRYLDTGAMYRAMAMYAQKKGVAFADEAGIERIIGGADIRVVYDGRGQRVLLGGEDVTDGLRTEALSMGASSVSKHPCVRKKLAELQREVGRQYDVVMDGRDITTNVLPHTKHKFYVTASPEERANRRLKELRARGDETETYEHVLEELKKRDHQDSTRAFMPLKKADDAMLVDTTALSIEQAIELVMNAIAEKEAR